MSFQTAQTSSRANREEAASLTERLMSEAADVISENWKAWVVLAAARMAMKEVEIYIITKIRSD